MANKIIFMVIIIGGILFGVEVGHADIVYQDCRGDLCETRVIQGV